MKILITGGAGFIGSHTAIELIQAGHQPIIIDNFSNSEKWILERIEKITGEKTTFYEGDCSDKNFLSSVFEREKDITGVIHFAAFKSVGESVKKPLKYYRNNLDSTLSLLETMTERAIGNFIFSSSATVYGAPKKSPAFSEKDDRQPATNPYGNTKAIIEDILRDTVIACENFSAISLRYFNPIGAHPSGLIGELPLGVPNNLIPYITQTAIGKRKELIIFGDDYDTPDGTGIRDFIHVVDLAKAHIGVLEYLQNQNGNFYDFFNVGTGEGKSVKEVVKTFEEVSGVKVPFKIGSRRAGDLVAYWADPSKINEIIGWRAEKNLNEALNNAWRWEKSLRE